MDAAGVLAGGVHVAGEVRGLGAERAGGRVGPVVGIGDPAAAGVQQVRGVGQIVQALPVGGRVGAVDGLGVVEAVVAAGHELRVQIGDLAGAVGEDGVVRGIGLQRRDLQERGVVVRLGAQVRLLQRRDRLEHHGEGDPLAVLRADDRAMVGAIDREGAGLHRAVGGAVGHADRGDRHGTQGGAVAVEGLAALVDDGLGELVHGVGACGGVHPAGAVVEPLVDEELAPGRGAVGVQPGVTGHLGFRAEIERGVRVDQQQGVAAGGVRGRDGDPVGACGLLEDGALRWPQAGDGVLAVEPLQVGQVDALDVPADTALGEAQRHPGFEAHQGAGVGVGMGAQVIVQAVGPGVHERLQPGGA